MPSPRDVPDMSVCPIVFLVPLFRSRSHFFMSSFATQAHHFWATWQCLQGQLNGQAGATQRNNAAPVPLKQKNCFGKCTWASATLGQTLQVATCSSGMFPEQLLACPAGFPNKPTTPGFVCLHTRPFLVSVCVRF